MPEYAKAPIEATGYPAPDFDVREFARTAAGSHRGGLNLGAYRSNPLSAETLRLLRYLHIVERATMTHLRSVLVTATHKDARITAFLTSWAYEKFWIADALQQIALAHAPEGTSRDREPFRTPVERTIREAVYANIVGVPMIALHMTLGTVDEWLTQAAYGRISELEDNRQLSETVEHLLQLKRRQLSFFDAQARFRLDASPRAARLTRKHLAKTPWPIGAKAEPRSETDHFFGHTFGSAPELVAELDSRIDTLPGQSGLSLVRKAARL
ncbi:MAG: hypothetical protein LH471_06560 [Salinibacterium sp.]|nr:hypothetical protein [Salinibacterium sp.]